MVDFIEVVEKSPAVHVLHYKVNVFFFFEKSKKFNNVWMVQGIMKLNLFWKLIDHFVLLDFRFDNFFNGCNESSFMVPELF